MASVVEILDWLEMKLGAENFCRIFQTITMGSGSEFQDWEGMTRAATGGGKRTHIYYCHPYSAYERGSNENENRMIQRWVNEYPRGILDGRCAGRVLLEFTKEAGIEGLELLL